MNKEESLALYGRGKVAWNTWANEMLAEKAKLEKDVQWEIDASEQGANEATKDWMNKSSVDFYNHSFQGVANFTDFIFPGFARFTGATFSGNARFNDAKFNHKAWLHKAIFSGEADFRNAKFDMHAIFKHAEFGDYVNFENTEFVGEAYFIRAKFCADAWLRKAKFRKDALFQSVEFNGNARFHEAEFHGEMLFDQILFKAFADFSNACFKKKISFIAIHGNGYFSFKNTTFCRVPDFNQAHFIEAPQFDDTDFSKALNYERSTDNENLSSRWRSLKRLAIQGHDHERELFFFAEEIKSRRGVQDRALPNFKKNAEEIKSQRGVQEALPNLKKKPVCPGVARYWLGYFYQYLSDFGRSVMRPLGWLLFFGILFQALYLKYPIENQSALMPNNVETQEVISCDRSDAAIYLSVRSALPFLPATSYSENLSRSYACLYGKDSDGKENIPNAIVFISIFQTILSAILIFLLLLALRNHFRIK